MVRLPDFILLTKHLYEYVRCDILDLDYWQYCVMVAAKFEKTLLFFRCIFIAFDLNIQSLGTIPPILDYECQNIQTMHLNL